MNTIILLCFCQALVQAQVANGGQSDSAKIDYLAMEIRSAINYQTDILVANMSDLVKALLDDLASSKSLMPQVLQTLSELAALLRDETARSRELETSNLLSQMSSMNASLSELQKETRRLKREAKSFRSESVELASNVEKEKEKLNVHFDAVRDIDFSPAGNLTFTACPINEGGGMDAVTGVFTAPCAGTYYFTFHANTVKGNDGLVLLRHNGDIVGGAFDTDNFQHNTVAQAALVKLRKGDVVWIDILSGGVRSNDNLYIHFVGILIKPNV